MKVLDYISSYSTFILLSASISLATLGCEQAVLSGNTSGAEELTDGTGDPDPQAPVLEVPGTTPIIDPFLPTTTGTIPGTTGSPFIIPTVSNPTIIPTTTSGGTEPIAGSTTPTVTPGSGTASLPTSCTTQADINQYILARAQTVGTDFASPCVGNSFFLTYPSYGTLGCKQRMPYNVVGEAQINAFLSSINQGLNLGTTSRIIGLYVKEPYFVGRAVRQNDSGQCSMTTIRGKLFNGETDAQVQSEFNAWRALSLTQQLDEVFGAILLN